MKTIKVVTGPFRAAFLDLWEPGKPPPGQSKGKYGINLIFDTSGPVYEKVMGALAEIAKAEWGENWKNVVGAIGKDKKAIRKGNENLTKSGEVRNGFADKLYVVAKNENKPGAVHRFIDPATGKPKQLSRADGVLVGGVLVNAAFELKAFNLPGSGNMISAALIGVQFHSDDGVRFSGTATGAGDFSGEAMPEADPDADLPF